MKNDEKQQLVDKTTPQKTQINHPLPSPSTTPSSSSPSSSQQPQPLTTTTPITNKEEPEKKDESDENNKNKNTFTVDEFYEEFLKLHYTSEEELKGFVQERQLVIKELHDKYKEILKELRISLKDQLGLVSDFFSDPIMLKRKENQILRPNDIFQLMENHGLLYAAYTDVFEELVILPNSSFDDYVVMLENVNLMQSDKGSEVINPRYVEVYDRGDEPLIEIVKQFTIC